jgi:hypothetical protein
MNRYGRMAMEFTRENAPEELAQIEDPETFFDQAGEEIAARVAEVLGQIVGEPEQGESLEAYKARSSRSVSQAEEIVFSDHYLLTAPPDQERGPDTAGDPELATYYQNLDEANEVIANLYR